MKKEEGGVRAPAEIKCTDTNVGHSPFKCFDDRLSVIDNKMIWSDNGASIV